MVTRALLAVGAPGAFSVQPARAAADEPAVVVLPPAEGDLAQPLEQLLLRRRSIRSYSPQAIPLLSVSQLLWAAQGVTAAGGRRTAPSAGALYPLELHLVAARVEGLRPGAYRYVPETHRLRLVSAGSSPSILARAAHSQQALAGAAAVVVIAAVEERTAQKYGPRASRYVAFEAGAASQNLALQAAALALGTVVIGAFDDDAVARALRMAAGERPLALMPVGKPG